MRSLPVRSKGLRRRIEGINSGCRHVWIIFLSLSLVEMHRILMGRLVAHWTVLHTWAILPVP